MTTTEQQLEAVKNEIGHVLHHHRCAYTNGMSLRALYTEKERHFLFNLSEHPAPEVLRIPNCHGHMYQLATSGIGQDFGTLKILLDLSEASAEFQEAHAIIQPQIDRVAQLEAEIAAEKEAVGRLAAERQAAIEKATAEALAEVEARFSTPEPPAPSEPAKPFRGKVKLEESALA